MPTALVIQHAEGGGPAWLDGWFRAAGLTPEAVRPYAGDAVPSAIEHDALVVLGGPMGANDDDAYPWLTGTKALMRAYVRSSVPCLGICLGHQLLAVGCGGAVSRNPDGRQVGVVDVGLRSNAVDDTLLQDLTPPVRAVQWNNDVVTRLPEGAELLAEGEGGHPQAFRIGPAAWGVQFHPEAGGDSAATWAASERRRTGTSNAITDAAARDVRAAEPELRRTWAVLAGRFAAVATERAAR